MFKGTFHLFSVILLFLGSLSFANTYQVNSTAGCRTDAVNNYTLIQDAINAASAGDTVYVCYDGGTFKYENPVINKVLNVYGNQSGVVINALSRCANIFNITADNVRISNLTLRNATGTSCGLDPVQGYAIRSASSNLTIYGNNLSFNNNRGIYIYGGSNNSNISDNIVSNNSNGIYLDNSFNNIISNNNLSNNSVNGVSIFSAGNNGNNSITGNLLSGNLNGLDIRTLNNNINNNIIYGGNVGLLLPGGSNDTIINNSISNVSILGISLEGTYNSTFINNSISNVAFDTNHEGIRIFSGSGNNTILSTTIVNASWGIHILTNAPNLIANNTVINSTLGILLEGAVNNSIINNTVYGNSGSGVYLTGGSHNNTLASVTSHDNSGDGFLLDSGNGNIFYNDISYNNTQSGYTGFSLGGDNLNITNNTAYNNYAGIYISGANINATSNTAYNNSNYGFGLTCTSCKFISNTGFNNSGAGLSASSVLTGNNISANSFYNNLYGIYLSSFSFGATNTISYNNVFNNSVYGFFSTGSTDNNFSENNATNNTIQYHFDSASVANFTGVNRALQTPSDGIDLNISGSSIVTARVGSTYNNFTTSYGTIFFDNAVDVSIKLLALAGSGATASGCTDANTTCTLLTFSSNVVNITSTGSPTINLGMFYDTSATSANSGQINISFYNTSSSGWESTGQTEINTTAGTVRYDSLATFPFAVFGIASLIPGSSPSPIPATTTTTGGGSDNIPTVTAETQVPIEGPVCAQDGKYKVTTSNGADYEVKYNLNSISSGTAGGGDFSFDYSGPGSYFISVSKSKYENSKTVSLEAGCTLKDFDLLVANDCDNKKIIVTAKDSGGNMVSGASVKAGTRSGDECIASNDNQIKSSDQNGQTVFDKTTFQTPPNCVQTTKLGYNSKTISVSSSSLACKLLETNLDISSVCPDMVSIKSKDNNNAGIQGKVIFTASDHSTYPVPINQNGENLISLSDIAGPGDYSVVFTPSDTSYKSVLKEVSLSALGCGDTGTGIGTGSGGGTGTSGGSTSKTTTSGGGETHTFDLKTSDKGKVGEDVEITAYKDGIPYQNAEMTVSMPNGRSLKITTDKNGRFSLPLEFAGKYVISLPTDKRGITKNREVQASFSQPPPTLQNIVASVLEDNGNKATFSLILLLIVLIAAYLYLRSRRDKLRYTKPNK